MKKCTKTSRKIKGHQRSELMMMTSIKTKLALSFIIIIVAMIITSAFFLLMQLKIMERYKKITDNIVRERSLATDATEFILAYYLLSSDIRNEAKLQTYNQERNEIEGSITYLDREIIDEESRIAYRGVKNIWKGIKGICDKGIAEVLKGNIENIGAYYDEANSRNYYLVNGVSSLILKEITFAEKLQTRIQREYKLSLAIEAMLFIFITFFAILGSLRFANRLSLPLVKLSTLSKSISGGNLKLKVEKGLLERKDEIGILSNSFNTMVTSLEHKINEVEDSKINLMGINTELEKTRVELEEKNDRLTKEITERRKIEEELKSKMKNLEETKQRLELGTEDLTRAQEANLNMMEDLEESKTYIENVIANFLDTLIVINIDRTIRTVNRVALGLLGYKQEGELVGRHIRIVFDEENILNIVFEKGEARNYELSYKTKDNCLIPMLFSGSLMQDKEGNSIGIVGIAKDISERKKMEETLRDYTKKTEEINKELDDFTYIISHDLKEPLRSIDAFSKFIADDYKDKLDEQGRFYIERVRMNASRMQKLIEDLLEISRIERKKNILEEVEAEELIEEVKLRMEVRIKEKNVQITIRDKLPRVYCDRVRLTEVFANLISNAIKFNDKPMPLIEIGSSEKEGFYEFYVKDNGPGIEEQYFDKIFEIFQRLGKREDNEGTGAGLTIVKKIVQMHKGKIWVESKVGEGTIFRFTIPTKEKMSSLCKRKIGEILVEKKLITEEEIKKALEEQEGAGI